ncbi:MAG: ABC transporter substrate-binding protein [Phycisphaeraceae bacterium]|nr:ABC transporter substrate-binding protein [Phycisphaeraceae bacterium]
MTRPREHALNSAAPADGCAGLSILVSAWLAGIALTVLANTVVSADSRKRIPVEVLLFEVEEGLNINRACARDYEVQRPDVRIDISGGPRIAEKLRIRVLEGTFPEVAAVSINYWTLIRHGYVLPMDEYLDGPNWEGTGRWRDSFLPGSLDRYTYQGRTYGIPTYYNVQLLWYNKAMFARHGWQPPRTWPQLLDLCERIKAAGIWPMAFQGMYHGYARTFIDAGYYHLAGREAYERQQELAPGSFDNPQFIQALSWTQRLATQYFQPGSMGMNHKEAQLEFFLGHTAMVKCQASLVYEMFDKIPEDFPLGAFNLPAVEEGRGDPTAVNPGIGYFFVFRDSRNPREGADFVRFLTSRKTSGRLAAAFDIPTAVKGTEVHLSPSMQDVVEVIRAARTSFGIAPGEGYPEMEQARDDVRFKLLTGRITPREAAATLERGARAVRDKAADPDHVTVRHVYKPAILMGVVAAAILYWLVTTAARMGHARRSRSRPMVAGNLRIRPAALVVFVGPAVLIYTVFVIVPCARSFHWSLHRWDGLTDMSAVGLTHFRRMLFESDAFWAALKNNLFIMFVIPLFVLPLSLFLAGCISRRIKGAALFRVVFFFPNILGGVAATLLWMHLYNPQGGPINAALSGLGRAMSNVGLTGAGAALEGFAGFAWLSQDHLYWALIPMAVWGACGFNMILFLAAMESIPEELYESAQIDGASPWRQFRTITVPLIHEVLTIAIVFMVIGGMKTFEVIWLLTNQRPTTDTHVIGTLMVSSMFTEFKVGQATAIAVLLFVIVFVGTAVTLRLSRRERVEF